MSLDRDIAQELWPKYRQDLMDAAVNFVEYSALEDTAPTLEPNEIYSDLLENVWLKAVNTFDDKGETRRGAKINKFDFWINAVILPRYLANLTTHLYTDVHKFTEKMVPMPANVLNSLESKFEDPIEMISFNNMMSSLPSSLSVPLRFAVENIEGLGATKLNTVLRSNYGVSLQQLVSSLLEIPEFVTYVTE